MQPKINTERIDGKLDVLFYDGLVIATWDNGERYLSLEANGKINITVDGVNRYTNGTIYDFIQEYDVDDAVLRQMCAEGRIEWDANGWFEVMIGYKHKDGVVIFSDCTGDVWDNYDLALEGFESTIKDFNKPMTWLGKTREKL